jgi:hypothetical protein
MKAYTGSRCIAPLIHNHGMGVSGQHHVLAALPPGRNPVTQSWSRYFWRREKSLAPVGSRTADWLARS